jgi:hypothetical protein
MLLSKSLQKSKIPAPIKPPSNFSQLIPLQLNLLISEREAAQGQRNFTLQNLEFDFNSRALYILSKTVDKLLKEIPFWATYIR